MNTEVDLTPYSASDADLGEVERRIFRVMCGVVALALCLSVGVAPWRVTTGLLLGGCLSLVNYAWVRSFVRELLSAAERSDAPRRWRATRLFLRYFVLAGVVASAYWLDIVSLVAVLAGLCAFAVAGLIEGFVQLYLAFIQRKET